MANAKLKCTHCKERFPRESMMRTPAGNFCTEDHAVEYAQDKSAKARERQQAKAKREQQDKLKAARAAHRSDKEKLKTAGDYIKEAQAAVNRYIRLRDYGKPCISCGSLPKQKRGGTMDAGHYRSRGAAGHLRFNTFNIAGQCVRCNRYQSGNAVDFRLGLIQRIGLERVEKLEHDNEPRKFTIEYLKRIKRIFNKKTRIVRDRLKNSSLI